MINELKEDFEFTLFDRIEVVKNVNNQFDLINNSYVSISGGLDSTVTSFIIDLALPNNNIPRVFIDTGIEYNYIRDFVYKWKEKDNRIVIIRPSIPITLILNKYGYPFKSKQHSHNISIFQRNIDSTLNMFDYINNNRYVLNDYDFIHNLPNGLKTNVKYYFGVRERERDVYFYQGLP